MVLHYSNTRDSQCCDSHSPLGGHIRHYRLIPVDLGSTAPSTAGAARLPSLGPVLFPLVAALLAFTLVQGATERVAQTHPQLILAWAAGVALLTLLLGWVRTASLPPAGIAFVTASALFVGGYFAIEPFSIPYAALPPDHVAAQFHAHGRWAGVALALLGWRRPAFLFAATVLLWMMRELQTTLTGFYFSTLDIRVVAELIAFVCLGLCLLRALAARPAWAAEFGLDRATARTAALLIIAAAIGGHVGNYFYSALAKLALDGGVTSWLLDNRLADGMPGAIEKGVLPMVMWPAATQSVYTAMLALSVPINLAAWAIQAVGPFALWRRRTLIALALAYDVFHLAVFFSLGLLFWKWMAFNLIIVVTVAAMTDAEWAGLPRRVALVFALAGALFFRTATLAWYDSPGFAAPFFEARFDDGAVVRLPSRVFGSASYQVSQGEIYWPGGTGHFNFSIWGSVKHWDDLVAGRACRAPARAAPAAPRFGPPEAVGRYMQAFHRQLQATLDASGRQRQGFVPHHHVPSLGLPDPLAGRDLRRIVAYSYVVESVCLGIADGKLTRRRIARTELPVYDVPTDTILPR